MQQIILLELVLLAVSLLSSYMTWGPLTSREMVDYFGPSIRTDKQLSPDELYERRRKAGMAAEITRAMLIALFGLIALPFYSTSISVITILHSPFFQWAFAAVAVLAIIWNGYAGPRIFATRYAGEFHFFSRVHFKKYLRPYWAWIPYPLFIFGGIGLVTFMMIIGGISADINNLSTYVSGITALPLKDIEGVLFAIIRLRAFGDWITATSQKYILTTLLIFIYVVIEQRSSMAKTILDTSVERLKYVVWVGLLFTIGFSLIYLPLQYESLHLHIQQNLESLTTISIPDEHLNDVLSIQQNLDDHDLRWLLLHIITGYGNIITILVVSLSVFFWRLFFDKVPVRNILQLVVPVYIINKINLFAEGFQIDMKMEK